MMSTQHGSQQSNPDDLIVRRVRVDRSLAPQAIFDATGFVQYVGEEIVEMDRGEGEEVEVCFFQVTRTPSISDDDLEGEYKLRGLRPADVYSLAQVNIDDPEFVVKHPNCTHWLDPNGCWRCAFFMYRSAEKQVGTAFNKPGVDDWGKGWWFAGIRV